MSAPAVSAPLTRLWGARFAGGAAPELDRLNRSLPIDWRLWPFELRVDRAWLAELVAVGAVSEAEAERLGQGLAAVERRLSEAEGIEAEPDEDIHTLIERWLHEDVGDLASQLRLGRSRNDVVATDTRLWALAAAERTQGAILELQRALVDRAVELVDVPFPAYSHLQRAQPSRAAHWLLAHFWALERDRARVREAGGRLGELPLGAAAGWGSSLAIDRDRLASALGFADVCENSLDAVGGRDWVAEMLYVWAQTSMDVARLAEDLILYSTAEFGLVRLADAFSTGSSLMPQKRNPDGAELARARAGVLIGLLAGFLSTVKGLPSGYHKDLQEDKAALFTAERSLSDVLSALTGTVRTLEVRAEAAGRALKPGMLATDVAEYLAGRGVPFLRAHEAVGEMVRLAERTGRALPDLPAEALASIHPALAELAPQVWDVEAALERRNVRGGVGRRTLLDQIQRARARLDEVPDPA
ncbi:MAG: argininosuccinate lyase [Gemmatimonadota bacterium]